MKKKYIKPVTQVVKIQHTSIICTSVNSLGSNANMNYGGGGNGPARSRSFGGWDDEE